MRRTAGANAPVGRSEIGTDPFPRAKAERRLGPNASQTFQLGHRHPRRVTWVGGGAVWVDVDSAGHRDAREPAGIYVLPLPREGLLDACVGILSGLALERL